MVTCRKELMRVMDNSAAFSGIRDGAKDRLTMPKSCGFYHIVWLIFKFGAGQVGCVNQNQSKFDQTSLSWNKLCSFVYLVFVQAFLRTFFVCLYFVHSPLSILIH